MPNERKGIKNSEKEYVFRMEHEQVLTRIQDYQVHVLLCEKEEECVSEEKKRISPSGFGMRSREGRKVD